MRIDINTAKQKIKDYPYALLYMFSEVLLSETTDLGDVNWSECIEARFFGENGELRFWRESGSLVAATLSVQGETIISGYALDGRYNSRWKDVIIKQFLDYDEDGQAYISGTMLAGLGRNV